LILVCLIATAAMAEAPKRIVSGMPAITEILFAIGAQDQIVGVTNNCNFPPEAKKKEKIGGFFLNLEKVVSLNPDLVVMQEGAQKKDIAKFQKFGLPVYVVKSETIEDVYNNVKELGVVTGHTREAEQLIFLMRQRTAQAKEKAAGHKPEIGEVLEIWGKNVNKRQALVIVGFKPLVVAGKGTFIDGILREANVENAAKDANVAYPQYSFETLVTKNPQYIIIPKGLISKEQLSKDAYFKSLEAVRQGRVLFVDQDIISRPGPRLVTAIEQVQEFVYPHPR